jgi:LmbE family N-acetylglucosaminyl deacetylase
MVSVIADRDVERVLVVVAHPDDAEFWAGGTIAGWTDDGIEVTYCMLTDGGGGFDPNVPRGEIPRIRRKEQQQAASMLGFVRSFRRRISVADRGRRDDRGSGRGGHRLVLCRRAVSGVHPAAVAACARQHRRRDPHGPTGHSWQKVSGTTSCLLSAVNTDRRALPLAASARPGWKCERVSVRRRAGRGC